MKDYGVFLADLTGAMALPLLCLWLAALWGRR